MKVFKRKEYQKGYVTIATILSLVFASLPNFTKAAADTTLFFNPATTTITSDQQFSLDAQANPGTNAVSGVDMHVTFDATKFRLDSITPSATFSNVLAPAAIDNTAGTASISVAVPLSSPSVTTTTSVAVFSFHSLAAVTDSSIAFTTATIVSADGESGNALAVRTPGTVTVTGSDTTAPTVSMTAPASGTTVYGTTTTVTASASDTIGVVGVQFKLDGVALSAEDTVSPYSIVWDTTTIANGAHTLTAVARDVAGNATTSTAVVITVSNSTDSGSSHKKKDSPKKKITSVIKLKAGERTAPFITLSSPRVGTIVTNKIAIQASARDTAGIKAILFSTDNKYVKKKVSGSSISYTYKKSGINSGAKTFYVVAFDMKGNKKTAGITLQNGKVISIRYW